MGVEQGCVYSACTFSRFPESWSDASSVSVPMTTEPVPDGNPRYRLNRRLGGAQPGNCFVSFVPAYARPGCLVELDCKRPCPRFPCSLFAPPSFPFSLLGAISFPFSLPPTHQTSYPTLVELIGMKFISMNFEIYFTNSHHFRCPSSHNSINMRYP